MSAYFFDTSEDDSFLEVAKLIGELLDGGEDATVSEGEERAPTAGSRFLEESVELYAQQNTSALFTKYMGQLDIIFAHAEKDQAGKRPTDLEGALNILCHLVPRVALAGPGEVSRATAELAAALQSKGTPGSLRMERLQALATLHNVLPESEPESRHAATVALLACAREGGSVELLLPLVRGAAPRLAPRSRAAAAEANRLLTEVALSYRGDATGADRAAVTEAARRVVVDFCTGADAFTFDLADSPAVRELAEDAATRPLHALLTALLGGDAEALAAVQRASPDLLPSLGLAPEDALTKTRLMALAALALSRPVLRFEEVRDALGVPLAEVEPLVVRAVGRGLLDARIDQLARTVTVTRCEPRAFGGQDWRALQATLRGWLGALERAEQIAEDKKALLQQGLSAIKA
ncbi:hypothetical protein QBZ16_001025 [Prototheca wickerhamii]|uniref:PCI domain-containing protein n=1 Tax=Prototheca wickerhamii TaxID=3111 RepID=A0AAD9MGB9_PROWI|nr:hypothetical protein QBZ16_001025 [Prototheca wickerhamii]